MFPIVLGVILFTIYLLFFQYDRCILEHSTGVLAMRGCTLQIVGGEELVRELQDQSREENSGTLAWSTEDAEISMRKNCVSIRRSGGLNFPFRGYWPESIDCVWKWSVIRESHRIRPVNFIRNYRKIMGGK